MTDDGVLAAAPGSTARPVAEALSWLWRLGPVGDSPTPGTTWLGGLDEAEALSAAVRERRAAAAIVLAPAPGSAVGDVPAREARAGVAGFAPGASVFDTYTVFAGGRPVVRTRLGAHAVMARDRVLVLGADLAGRWGWLGAYWALEPIEELLLEVQDRPLLKLPALGSIRFDDLPGTAEQQLQGRDKHDRVMARRIRRMIATYREAGASLSVAVAARALKEEQPVPLQEVWPAGVEALAAGVDAGVFELVLHGWLHYDERSLREGEAVEPREFLALGEAEAGERIDAAIEWQRRWLGEPRTFVAPAWGYSPGALAAAAQRSLPAWQRAEAEPLIVDGNPRETLIGAGGPGGVHRLDYGSLVRLAHAGVPPTPVLHGGLLDDRLTARVAQDAFAYARLIRNRDVHRLPRVPGVRWISAGALVERLAAHDASEVRGDEPRLASGAEAVLCRRGESRLIQAAS